MPCRNDCISAWPLLVKYVAYAHIICIGKGRFTLCECAVLKSLTSLAQTNLGRGVATPSPPRWRMHSPAACASCTMRNVTEPLRNVSEALRDVTEHTKLYSPKMSEPLQNVTELLRNCYGKYRFCPSLIKFYNFVHH